MKPPQTPPVPRRPSGLVRLCWANLAALAALFALADWIAERTWPTTLLAYAPPLLYTPVTGLLLLTALVRRNRAALGLTGLAALLLGGPILGLRIPTLPSASASGPRLRLMTWNIAHGTGGTDAIARIIRDADPDVVCLQEVNGWGKTPDPLPGLVRTLPGYRWERAGEVAIGSRLPTGRARPCPLLTRAGVYRVALAVPITPRDGQVPVTVTTVHLATAATAESLSLRKDGIPSYLRRTTGARGEQIQRLNQFQGQLTGPTVICGDFNTPPRGILYRRLREGRTDVFAARGRGAGWTFSSKHPLLRIDHVFTSPQIVPVGCCVLDVAPGVSDHLPVVADLRITPGS